MQRNQLIDVDHFLDYLRDQREQKRKLDEKNKKRKDGKRLKRGDSLQTDASAQRQSGTMKGLILSLFRSRGKDTTPLFHSS